MAMLHLGGTQGQVKTVFGNRLPMRLGSAEASQLLIHVMGCSSLIPPSIYIRKFNSGRWWGLRNSLSAVISSFFLLSKLSFPTMTLCCICRIPLIVIFILTLRLSKISLWKQCSYPNALSPEKCYMGTFNHKISKKERERNPSAWYMGDSIFLKRLNTLIWENLKLWKRLRDWKEETWDLALPAMICGPWVGPLRQIDPEMTSEHPYCMRRKPRIVRQNLAFDEVQEVRWFLSQHPGNACWPVP